MRRPRLLPALAAAAATVALLPVAASPAVAEDTPTSMELLEKCDEADYCEFHQDGDPVTYSGDAHRVGDILFNCGPGDSTQTQTWIETTGETNSVGISLVQESELFEIFKEKFTVTYGHEWGTSDSTRRSTSVTIPAGQKAWLVRSTPMQKISGTYELHFEDKYYGHYYWYVPFTITAENTEAVDDVTQMAAEMTDDEKADHSCA